jgi:hypothetical protein
MTQPVSAYLLARTRKEGMECWFASYKDMPYKDIGDMRQDLVELFIEGAKHSVFGERAIYS